MISQKKLKIGFQMCPMEQTVPGTDNTILLMQECCQRGHDVYHFLPDQISLDDTGRITGLVCPVTVDLSVSPHYQMRADDWMDLSEFDAIFFRQDPPFDLAYITNTHILERISDQVLFVNHPRWIRGMPDKISIFDFPEFLAPTLVSKETQAITNFFTEHGPDIVAKPLYGFHGHGIERSSDLNELLVWAREHNEPLMFQPFLKEIEQGNKRIVLFDGEVAGSLITIPDNDFRIYRDSEDLAYELTDRERVLFEKMGPLLKERGLLFVGVDLIGPYLTEINVGSVASIVRLNAIYGGAHEKKLIDIVENKLGV